MRIVSLVPSLTELLAYLQLENEVVGITKFCVHPEDWLKEKRIIGGTKNFHLDRIHELAPDLIIANKEENDRERVEKLQQQYKVYVSEVKTFADAMEMIIEVGRLTQRIKQSRLLVAEIENSVAQLSKKITERKKAIYLIWQNPYMTVGGDTFIHSMMDLAGFDNLFTKQTRYPEVKIKTLQELKPEVILLSSEPYPFKDKHIAELKKLSPASKIMLVDGELFSWYGSRMLLLAEYFIKLQQQL